MATPQQQLNKKATFISGAAAVTKNVKAIIRQGDITVPELPNLPSYQQEARQVCQEWMDSIWPTIARLAEDIIEYARTFQYTYQQLLNLLKQGDVVKIDVELQKLLTDLNQYKSESDDVTAMVKSFCDKYQTLYSKFQLKYVKASDAITSDNATLAHLQAEKASLDKEAYHYELMQLIPFAGIYYAIKYQETEEKISTILKQILSLSANLHSLEAVHYQLAALQNYNSKIISFSQDVTDGWQSLADNMTDLIKHVSSASSDDIAIVIKIQLSAANKEWQNVLSQTGKLEQ